MLLECNWNNPEDAALTALLDEALATEAASDLEWRVMRATRPSLERLAVAKAMSAHATPQRWSHLLDEALAVDAPPSLERNVLAATGSALRTAGAKARSRATRWDLQMDHLLDDALAVEFTDHELESGVVAVVKPRLPRVPRRPAGMWIGRSWVGRWGDRAFLAAATFLLAAGAGVILTTWDFGRPYQPLSGAAQPPLASRPSPTSTPESQAPARPVMLARIDSHFQEFEPPVQATPLDDALDVFNVELAATEAAIVQSAEPWDDDYLAMVYEMDLLTNELRSLYY